MKTSLKGSFALLTASILFGSYGLWARIVSAELSVYQQTFLRYLAASLILLLIILIRKTKINIAALPKKQLLLYGAVIPTSFVLFNFAVLNAKLSVSVTGLYFGMIVTGYFLGRFFFSEKVTQSTIVSSVAAFAGLLCILLPSLSAGMNVGFVLGILSGSTYSIASVLKKQLKDRVSRIVLIEISAVAVLILLLPTILVGGMPTLTNISPIVWLGLAAYTAVALFTEFLTIVGFQNYEINLGSIILSGEIAFAGIIGYLFFQEIPTTWELAGILLIMFAAVYPSLRDYTSQRRQLSTG